MAKPRVHEVAKELGVTSKEVLAHLEKIGEAVKSHSSTIDEELAERVKAEMSGGVETGAQGQDSSQGGGRAGREEGRGARPQAGAEG